MKLTDGQKTHIAFNIKVLLGDAYWLYGQGYCERFEKEVLLRMKNGMTFGSAETEVWNEWKNGLLSA